MTMPRFKLLAAAVTIMLLGGIGAAAAGDSDAHVYCPRGSTLYWLIFGPWCEDDTLNGVQPIQCKTGPGQALTSWTDNPLDADNVCSQKTTLPSQRLTTTE